MTKSQGGNYRYCLYCKENLTFASEMYLVYKRYFKGMKRKHIGFCCTKCRDEGKELNILFYK